MVALEQEDYALMITWLYFSFYAVTFLIASMGCVIEVKDKESHLGSGPRLATLETKNSKKNRFFEHSNVYFCTFCTNAHSKTICYKQT